MLTSVTVVYAEELNLISPVGDLYLTLIQGWLGRGLFVVEAVVVVGLEA